MSGRARKPRAPPAICRYCTEVIRLCHCLMCATPGWYHWPAKYHRCGPQGKGRTFAEPERNDNE